MKNLNNIASDLFNKIRGRFNNVTIGNENGEITNVPEEARFFDFSFIEQGADLGKVSVALDEENGVTVIVGRDIAQNQVESVQDRWFNFLKELRIFAKKRTLPFDVRDINKSNLDKRDYQFLATNRPGEEKMAESKMYGTKNTSFQRIGNARLAIKHNAPIGEGENRLKNIRSLFIETPEGERIKYPVKHLQGARALALHVSEGGHPYDEFGKYITGLSEELASLNKFKTYMNRKSVMAEALAGYMDSVQERTKTVRKEIQNLQKPAYYAEAVANYVAPIVEDVPEDVSENWIDQLTIKQFNEELKDVFPYIYKLVGEATKAKELEFEDIVAEAEKSSPAGGPACWDGKKIGNPKTKMKGGKRVNNCVPESLEDMIETAVDQLMGQFAENENDLEEAYIKTSSDAINTLGALRKIGKKIETGQDTYDGNLAGMYVNDVYDVLSWLENNADTSDPKFKQIIEPVVALRKKAKGMERELGSGKNARFGNEIVNTLYPLMQWIEMNVEDTQEGDDTIDVKMTPDGGIEKADNEKQKTPIGEFILSYFDRENGTFPKGETAVLTMVEKDYGPQYVEPAAQFIKKVESAVAERQAQEAEMSRYPETNTIKALAGLR